MTAAQIASPASPLARSRWMKIAPTTTTLASLPWVLWKPTRRSRKRVALRLEITRDWNDQHSFHSFAPLTKLMAANAFGSSTIHALAFARSTTSANSTEPIAFQVRSRVAICLILLTWTRGGRDLHSGHSRLRLRRGGLRGGRRLRRRRIFGNRHLKHSLLQRGYNCLTYVQCSAYSSRL